MYQTQNWEGVVLQRNIKNLVGKKKKAVLPEAHALKIQAAASVRRAAFFPTWFILVIDPHDCT